MNRRLFSSAPAGVIRRVRALSSALCRLAGARLTGLCQAGLVGVVSLVVLAGVLGVVGPAGLVGVVGRAAGQPGWVYPVGPPGGPVRVVHDFDPPSRPWHPGHRGVDLAGTAGAEVRSAAAGRVVYAGRLAGRGVVAVDHGAVRTTYEPVAAVVRVGDLVAAGQPIGALSTRGSHCAPAVCLHWGARRGAGYIDPMSLARRPAVRLLPPRGQSSADPPSGQPPSVPPASLVGAQGLRWPVAEPRVTSPYGMRVHPITGVYKLHDGMDLAAACGTPLRAAAPGRVTHVGWRGAYGLQVTVEHGLVAGVAMTTSYSHLSHALVAEGQHVVVGETVGLAGATGASTGCHLHFMVYAGGTLSDPADWLPGPRATSYLAISPRKAYGR